MTTTDNGPAAETTDPTNDETPRYRGLYAGILFIMILAILARVAQSHVFAFTAAAGLRDVWALGLQSFLLAPLVAVSYPIPYVVLKILPTIMVTAFWLLQVLLVLRRCLLCVRAGAITAPAAMTSLTARLLKIGGIAWLINLASASLVLTISVFIVLHGLWSPFLILAGILFIGPVFFYLEVRSIREEGFLPVTANKAPNDANASNA